MRFVRQVAAFLVALGVAFGSAPLSTVHAQTPGDSGANTGGRAHVGGGSVRLHTWWTRTGHYGDGRFGHQTVHMAGANGGAGGGGGGDDDDGPVVCTGTIVSVDPWDERLPIFDIHTAPGYTQGGIVNFKSQFWLDGEFDGRAYERPVMAHRIPIGFLPDGTCGQVGDAEPVPLRMHYWAVRYQWDYGDGAKPAPVPCGELLDQPEDCPFDVHQPHDLINHYYRVSSGDQVHEVRDDEGVMQTYRGYLTGVLVTFAMGISADADGAPVTPLRTVDAQAWRYYQVREVQSVLTQ